MCSGFNSNAENAAALVEAAIERTTHRVHYDGAYRAIDYPNGDVPAHIGVCTDVVIRSFRAIGTDLQVLVHEDMQDHFDHYPSRRIWGLSRLTQISTIDACLIYKSFFLVMDKCCPRVSI